MANLENEFTNAVQREVDRVREQVIERAVEDFRKELRTTMARASLSVLNEYSMTRLGNELVIRVKVE